MRSTLENNWAYATRSHSTIWGALRHVLPPPGEFIIDREAPVCHFLDASEVLLDFANVYLPPIDLWGEYGGLFYFVSNEGTKELRVHDRNGVEVDRLFENETSIFLSSPGPASGPPEAIAFWKSLKGVKGHTHPLPPHEHPLPEPPRIVTTASATIAPEDRTVVIQRGAGANPSTSLTLPLTGSRPGMSLHIVDWTPDGFTDHTIGLTPSSGETIMRQTSFVMVSTPFVRQHISLVPSPELDGWYQI